MNTDHDTASGLIDALTALRDVQSRLCDIEKRVAGLTEDNKRMRAKLIEAVEAWPQFDVGDDECPNVSGADLIEFFDGWRTEAKAVLIPQAPDAQRHPPPVSVRFALQELIRELHSRHFKGYFTEGLDNLVQAAEQALAAMTPHEQAIEFLQAVATQADNTACDGRYTLPETVVDEIREFLAERTHATGS
jgi:hypothetical protein